jgi:hypothetical protein
MASHLASTCPYTLLLLLLLLLIRGSRLLYTELEMEKGRHEADNISLYTHGQFWLPVGTECIMNDS